MELTPERASVDLSQYALLRTILDSLETGALRYYLGASNDAERDAHFTHLKNKLTPLIHLSGRSRLRILVPMVTTIATAIV